MKKYLLFFSVLFISQTIYSQGDIGDIGGIYPGFFTVLKKNKVSIVKMKYCFSSDRSKYDTCSNEIIYLVPEAKMKKGNIQVKDSLNGTSHYFFYNKKDQLICDSSVWTNGIGSPYVLKYDYDKKGRIIKTLSSAGSEIPIAGEREYNGDTMLCYRINKAGMKELFFVQVNDEKGNPIKLFMLTGKGRSPYSESRYDKKGNLIKEIYFTDKPPEVWSTYLFKYDSKDLAASCESTSSDSPKPSTIYYEYKFFK